MNFSPQQNLYLLRLAFAPEGPPLKGDIKPMSKAGDRNQLEAAELIQLTKKGRTAEVALTDRGWSVLRTAKKLALSNSAVAAPILSEIFRRFQAFAEPAGASLTDLFLEQAALETGPPVAGEKSLAERIRGACRALASQSGSAEVRLKDLRRAIGPADRESVDFCLGGMVMAGVAQARQIDDSLAIDAADREAALQVGGTARHTFQLRS